MALQKDANRFSSKLWLFLSTLRLERSCPRPDKFDLEQRGGKVHFGDFGLKKAV